MRTSGIRGTLILFTRELLGQPFVFLSGETALNFVMKLDESDSAFTKATQEWLNLEFDEGHAKAEVEMIFLKTQTTAGELLCD